VTDVTKLKRSYNEKSAYFSNHNVKKSIGFELHHIIPLLWARNSTEFFLLDKWENMLYIDAYSHSVITQSGNKHVKLDFVDSNNDITLSDPLGDVLKLENEKNVKYSPNLSCIMYNKNQELLESF